MAVPEQLPAEGEPDPAVWLGTAFGLTVEARRPVPGLPAGRAAGAGRRVAWTITPLHEPVEAPQARAFTPLVDRRHPDGRPFMTVERHTTGCYRISAPGFGVHVVAPDGASIRSTLPDGGGRRWQRLFFAQALPLSAALNGLELLHASAVEVGGTAVAFSGPPGTGKTSLAVHLVALGARFVTDDVLAVEPDGAAARVHAGPGLVNVDPVELAALGHRGRSALVVSDAPGDDGKLAVETTPARTPLPLGAVCFLSRVTAGKALELRRAPTGGIQTLLGSGFLPYLQSQARLARHLDVCARVAAAGAVYQLRIPTGTSARETADFLLRQLTGTPSW